MPKPSLWKITDSFDPSQVAIVDRAVERAWSVVRWDHGDDPEARSLLSLCVMNEARYGEENHMKLVNCAIIQFRRQWAVTDRKAN